MAASLLSPTFIIGSIRIGSVEGASCINLGNNLPVGFTSRKTHNQGFGNIQGDDNRLNQTRSFLHETSYSEQKETEPGNYAIPDWVKNWMGEVFAPDTDEPNTPQDDPHSENKPENATLG